MIRVDSPNPAGMLADLARDMVAANRAVGRTLAADVRKAHNAAIKATGRGTLSGMRVTLGVKAKPFVGPQRVVVDVVAWPPGPWSIREHGRNPVKVRRSRALGIPGYPRGSARKARGRDTWDPAMAAAVPVIGRAIDAAYDRAMLHG